MTLYALKGGYFGVVASLNACNGPTKYMVPLGIVEASIKRLHSTYPSRNFNVSLYLLLGKPGMKNHHSAVPAGSWSATTYSCFNLVSAVQHPEL